VYNADGEFLFKFGSHGEGNGQFNAPTGVAVDANGNIIVADWGNSRIQVSFTKIDFTECRNQLFEIVNNLQPVLLYSRCSTAQGLSSPTLTRQLTHFMALRAWLLHLMAMWQWQTPGTTALRSTATCSRDLRQPSPPLQALTTQPMYSTGCDDISSTAF